MIKRLFQTKKHVFFVAADGAGALPFPKPLQPLLPLAPLLHFPEKDINDFLV